MTQRKLPAHIEAALAGNVADSAGRPWEGRDLSGEGNPLHAFDKDDGGIPPAYEKAVRDLVAGRSDEAAVVRALARIRVFVPVIAELGGADSAEDPVPDTHSHGDKEADMALVTIKAPDGRRALPVFTSTAQLERWHPDARPVAVYAARAALAAVAEKAELMVVDPGADVTFVVRRPALWALAQQKEWAPSYSDPALARLLGDAAAPNESIRRVEAAPGAGVSSRTANGTVIGGGGAGPELLLTLVLREGLTQEAVRSTVQAFQSRLQNLQDFVERVDSLEIRLSR
ncbi:SseB family protein [Arthrobacter sp. JZ12]|uniref:SseB family protein n=1 Tax=Arthrobacter sp. JZ12 TaxID=2654190 RepID=UPI002B46262F|nr:SseB family protein [Arthrobacter sp. JZ12]WRH24643.1 SseB family protein [Arthrobacter sp. JZ12]